METKKFQMNGREVGSITLKDEVFAAKSHPQTVTDVVKAQLNNERQGTLNTKTRGEVRGGGRKPWRQKGTGRARQGSTVSPLWPGGGCTFGPRPRTYDHRPPRQMVDVALRGVLTELAAHQRVRVVENLTFDSGKTADVVKFLAEHKLDKALLVLPEVTAKSKLATRNLKCVKVVTPHQVNVVDLLKYGHLAISDKAVRTLEEVLVK